MSASNRSFSPYFQEDDPKSLGLSNMFDMPQPQVREAQLENAKSPYESIYAAAALISHIADANLNDAQDENGLLGTDDVTKRDIT
ncbi:MAG: hypothetical protein MRY32_00620 [Rickettsiales bacterium]|nr:hypothetical protein [Rickettsiales bacterium]